MPDWDATRTERLEVTGERFRTPDGFRVEQVADNELVGSVVNFTFDPDGRPLVALEKRGLHLLDDRDGDGHFETLIPVSNRVRTAHGLYVLGPGDLLVHADGPEEGAGLYRLRGWGEDGVEATVELVATSAGGIQEHGPHTITRGPDGDLYLLFGNHASPNVVPAPGSRLRALSEDQLLPVLLDPRGHANSIRAPGGTIWRLDLESNEWQLLTGGLRNPFDMAFGPGGGLFVYEADMEWDRGLPWYRPTRVLHAIPAGDYGWRTGSGKIAFDSIDTLPSVADIGRGSPVGVVFYRHHVYPARFEGALFLGDWARGRIRVLFPEKAGASWTGPVDDFVLGEPLNVTDLDVGPDGHLYYSTGGRETSGGLFRVVYDGPQRAVPSPGATAWENATRQPMPRTAWGRKKIESYRRRASEGWEAGLRELVKNANAESSSRRSALELLQVHGPPPTSPQLSSLLDDPDPGLRAAAVLLLGTHTDTEAVNSLATAIDDDDALVRRRACEALARTQVDLTRHEAALVALVGRLGDEDRWVRYAAREALIPLEGETWRRYDTFERPSAGAAESLLTRVLAPGFEDSQAVFAELAAVDYPKLERPLLGAYLRLLELALIRDPALDGTPAELDTLATALLELYPTGERTSDRKLERLLAHMAPPGAVAALLHTLDQLGRPEEEIHVVNALRSTAHGVGRHSWNPRERDRLVDWFERGREIRGAASMGGYIEALWQDTLSLLTPSERKVAEERRAATDRETAQRRAELLTSPSEEPLTGPDMGQMSFEELAEYLEYDVMAYELSDADAGALVFERARCADCHVFGSSGRGGGPDLSTVVKRFRRREILESIMYPSRVISDQYGSVLIQLEGGELITGLNADESETQLTLITASGVRRRIEKAKITSREKAVQSLMPEGLLDALSFSDLVNLIRFLEDGGQDELAETIDEIN